MHRAKYKNSGTGVFTDCEPMLCNYLLIFLFRHRQSTNWSSTSRLRNRLVSQFDQLYSTAPTR
jgi:hypothetical protein